MNTPYPNKHLPIYLIALGAFALGMAGLAPTKPDTNSPLN